MVPGAMPGPGSADRRGTAGGAFSIASYPDYGSAGPAQVRPAPTRTEANNTMPQQDFNREQFHQPQPTAGTLRQVAVSHCNSFLF